MRSLNAANTHDSTDVKTSNTSTSFKKNAVGNSDCPFSCTHSHSLCVFVCVRLHAVVCVFYVRVFVCVRLRNGLFCLLPICF